MSNLPTDRELRMVPIDRIDVLNPRERDPEVFAKIVENIRAIGLKKPITVTPRAGTDGAERYLLVCGEGRLTAFRVLGETRIPALVVDATDEDAYLMSLSENIARRKYRALELLSGIGLLKEKGHSAGEIAEPWRTITHLNPILYLVSGYRWTFFGVSDVPIWASVAMTAAVIIVPLTAIIWIFRSGYRLKS